MRPLHLLILGLLAAAGYAAPPEQKAAPSGGILLRADVPTAEVSPSFRLRVRLVFVELESAREHELFTGASGDWAIVWAPGDVLLLFATKNEDGDPVHAFEVRKGKVTQRRPSGAEMRLAHDEYKRKHPR